MSNELTACDAWIIRTLAGQIGRGDPALNGVAAYADIVPEGAAFPCLLFSCLSAKDRVGPGAVRLLTRPLYFIRAVGQGDSFALLKPLATAMDGLLQQTSLQSAYVPPAVIDSVTVRGAFREEAHQSSSVTDGVRYIYLGGLYRIHCYQD